MVNIKELDPGASPLAYFGSELRRLRTGAELTLDRLGRAVFLTGSQIGQFENAVLMPKLEHLERLDAALNADGALLRLWPLISRSALPKWFQKQANLEQRATEMYTFNPQLVHGLLQTEGYARAVLGAMHSNELDTRVVARLERQKILKRDEPPVLWAVLSEAVLYQEIGGKEVMREQLAHLLSFRTNDLGTCRSCRSVRGCTRGFRERQGLAVRGHAGRGLSGGLRRGRRDRRRGQGP